MLTLNVTTIDWPLREPFTISRETITSIACIQVTLTDADGNVGRGEAVGIDYAGETPVNMIAQIEAARRTIEMGLTRAGLQRLLPYGGARNAIDCALWDLEAKRSGVPVWQAAGLERFEARLTAFSFGIMDEKLLQCYCSSLRQFSIA